MGSEGMSDVEAGDSEITGDDLGESAVMTGLTGNRTTSSSSSVGATCGMVGVAVVFSENT
ncbi:hypothetical protein E9993_23165 [Labilibacter sediminis]|nr:hypothetical protein E9993_23165 [Labilibacter sediminis]